MNVPPEAGGDLPRPLSLPLLLTLPLCVCVFIAASLQGLALQPAAWAQAQGSADAGAALWAVLPLVGRVLLVLLSWLTAVRIVFRGALATARLFVSLALAWAVSGTVSDWAQLGIGWRLLLLCWCGALLALSVALWREREPVRHWEMPR